MELAVAMNIDQGRDQTELVVSQLLQDGWTVDRIRRAVRFGRGNREVLKTIGYAGAITPLTITEAEYQMDKVERPDLGKCYTPYCGQRATHRAFGEVYCSGCYTRHREDAEARRRSVEASQRDWSKQLESRRQQQITGGGEVE